MRLLRDLTRFEGDWEAYELDGREPGKKMDGAFLTTITAKPWWSGRTLDVRAKDWDSQNRRVREHYGPIVLDSHVPTQCLRTIIYQDSLEVVHQRVEFGADPEVLLVTPTEPGYNKHALRRTRRRLDY
jgi:predicted ATPase